MMKIKDKTSGKVLFELDLDRDTIKQFDENGNEVSFTKVDIEENPDDTGNAG